MSKPPTYHIWTIGCQMNRADSTELAESLHSLGYVQASAAEEADVVVLNSCVVRQRAEDRVVSRLAQMARLKEERPDILLALTGCMVEPRLDGLARRFPQVDVFAPPQQLGGLLEKARERAEGCAAQPSLPQRGITAFVPIIHGCDHFCSYCIVPYRRGRQRSRLPEEIACEVEALVRRGVREVTLLGQNVDAYGHDLGQATNLALLLRRLAATEGLVRIRFLTSHPQDMTPDLIDAVAELPQVCEYINLPVQAGDDDILRAMRRPYTVADYRRLVHSIREAIPNVGLVTDVIVGFPGESAEQFRRTYDLLAELRFDTVHVAAYSPRPGTIAARTLSDDVPAGEKKQRKRLLEELQEEISLDLNQALVGQEVEVLAEKRTEGRWEGRTRQNKLVHFDSEQPLAGRLVNVAITSADPYFLRGEPADMGAFSNAPAPS